MQIMKTEQRPNKALNILLWVAQVLLASSMVWAACMKLLKPADELAAMWPWTAAHPALVKMTGVLDLLGALGLVLPGLLRMQPRLTVYSAYAIIALMIAASIFHIVRGEANLIGVNIFFAVLAVLIAWGRRKLLR